MSRSQIPDDRPDVYHDESGAPLTSPEEYRRVAYATMVGTTIEWYDFFIYAQIAALLFGKLFFSGLGELGQLTSLATIGVSFFFRPLGAIVMGHVGDRFGRRAVLVLTLGLMGVATTLVGLLPTAASIGVAAPILLIILRCLQGLSAGGEWGGAAMLAVEHAPRGKRGLFGAYPQVGVPLGMMLATIMMGTVNGLLGKEAFDAWGWRIPFVFSIVLVFIGQYVRSRVSESPVFAELEEAAERSKAPLGELLSRHPKEVFTAAASFLGNNALGYMIVGGFVLAYATKVHGLSRDHMLRWVFAAAVVWLVFTIIGAIWSDRIGRTKVYKIGYVLMAVLMLPQFWLIAGGTELGTGIGLLLMGVPSGLTYGPQSAMFAEMFPAKIRLSGVSLAYAIGAVFGGAFAPMIAQYLTTTFGTVVAVAPYLLVMSLISLGSIFLITDRTNEPLHTMSGH
ncbi:MFS transporter [Mobilicoccus massiliensis]|uniref:MFS transporter n=1 Tax=Mobilicoccus massiliensis TaxID=1522310 RepID=UPI0009E25862|nr:MFS transporter [Mobilicoccus massiliensis]